MKEVISQAWGFELAFSKTLLPFKLVKTPLIESHKNLNKAWQDSPLQTWKPTRKHPET